MSLIPSSTVVLIRDRDDDIEILMLQKSANINYGGTWVFPGGVIETQDIDQASLTEDGEELAAKYAVARETLEEAGIQIDAKQCVAFSHWTTPKFRAKRYATWFFAYDASHIDNEIEIDQGEIVAAQWFTPQEALAAQSSGQIMLNGPAYVTLSELLEFKNSASVMQFYRSKEMEWYEPYGVLTKSGVATIYHDDSDYQNPDIDEAKIQLSKPPLHRLYMHKKGPWEYVRKQ